jgi:hypothetical protein
VREEARRLIACDILEVLVGTMLLVVNPTQIIPITLGHFAVSFALCSLLASEAGLRFGVNYAHRLDQAEETVAALDRRSGASMPS